ncbi:MAG: hypothetical protein ACPHO6_17185, partial [Candidatus Latescibacterota bacterium]
MATDGYRSISTSATTRPHGGQPEDYADGQASTRAADAVAGGEGEAAREAGWTGRQPLRYHEYENYDYPEHAGYYDDWWAHVDRQWDDAAWRTTA